MTRNARALYNWGSILSGMVVCFGLSTLLGWHLGVESLKSVFPGLVAMNPLTASAFLLVSLGIFFHLRLPRVARLCALGAFAIGLIRLLGYFGATDILIDRVLFRDKLGPNVMAPNTALNFMLIGVALSLASGGNVARRIATFCASTVLLIALMAMIGYVYGFAAMYKVKLFIPMAVNTAAAFLLAGLAVSFLMPSNGMLSILSGEGPGSDLARRLFPATLIIPAVLGGLNLMAEQRGFYGSEFGLMVMAMFTIIVFNALIFDASLRVNRADAAMKSADAALKLTNDLLEQRVEERSAELKKAQQQLVQQERLRALGQMASGIAHDFNNALSPILGYSEILIDDPDVLRDRTTTLDYLRTMNVAARDAASVVRRLREFSRPKEESGNVASIELNSVVKQVVVLTQPKWKNQMMAKGLNVEVRTKLERIEDIRGDVAEIRELLTNLIFNAVDAMPNGGILTLETGYRDDRVILKVSDTGTGMSEEVRRRCLEPFFTTKGEKGTGLGLSMVYGIVQRHDGTVEIDSREGHGTTFILSFPAGGDEGFFSKDASLLKRPVKSFKILYVEDDIKVRRVISLYLKRDGHAVDEAADGRSALELFLRGSYDLVITDHAMPGISGSELTRTLKKLAPVTPVLMISGTAYDVGREAAEPDVILKKPVAIDDLRRALERLSL